MNNKGAAQCAERRVVVSWTAPGHEVGPYARVDALEFDQRCRPILPTHSDIQQDCIDRLAVPCVDVDRIESADRLPNGPTTPIEENHDDIAYRVVLLDNH